MKEELKNKPTMSHKVKLNLKAKTVKGTDVVKMLKNLKVEAKKKRICTDDATGKTYLNHKFEGNGCDCYHCPRGYHLTCSRCYEERDN